MTLRTDLNQLDGEPGPVYSASRPVVEAIRGIRMRIVETTGGIVRLSEFNPHHDKSGRFTSKGGHASLSTNALVKQIGGSLDTDGGLTVGLGGGAPSDGIMVSLDPGEGHGVVLSAASKGERDAAIKDWVAKERQFIKDKPDHYLGGWVDSDSGKTYMDVSQRFSPSEKAKAIEAGRARNQKAIFDLGTFEEIDTGGTGE